METDDGTAPHIRRVTCDNPSPMTLEGTHTYVIGHQDAEEAVIVDPGPEGHREHLRAVFDALGDRTVTEILVTHRHGDHTGAAKAFSARTGAAVRGLDPRQCLPGGQGTVLPLREGEVITLAGTSVTVLHTPGHTSDSVCLWVPEAEEETAPQPGTGFMLTGDTVLGRGTTMLDFPDGTLTDYLAALHRLAGLGDVVMLPAHGPARPSLRETAEEYLSHREQRLEQIRELLAEHGAGLTAERLGALIYGEQSSLPEGVTTKIAAAQLEHLHSLGEL